MAEEADWQRERTSGMAAIAIAGAVSLVLWFALYRLLPPLAGIDAVGARMVVALKCFAIATLFTLVAGVEAVAHERLQSDAFDPLAGHQTKRLRVNLRFLQNTLEQIVIFGAGLFGLAVYLTSGEAMRGLGAPSMAIGLIMLLYVAARIGNDIGGAPGAILIIGLYLALEAILFWKTR